MARQGGQALAVLSVSDERGGSAHFDEPLPGTATRKPSYRADQIAGMETA